MIKIFAVILSYCSVIYQFSLIRMISELADQSFKWQCLSGGFFLLGNGMGFLFFPHLKKRSNHTFFVEIEVVLAGAAILSPILFCCLHIFYRFFIADFQDTNHFGFRSLDMTLLLYELIPIFIGFLTGLEFLALSQIAEQNLNKLIACYYLGALFATILFPYFLFKTLSNQEIIYLSAFLNITILSVYVLNYGHYQELLKIIIPCILLALAFIFREKILEIKLRNFYFNYPVYFLSEEGTFISRNPLAFLKQENHSWIKRKQSPYQTIDWVNFGDSELTSLHPNTYSLFLNGHVQFSSQTELDYHQSLAKIASILIGYYPENPLILGGGDGLLAREILKNESVKSLTLVELDPIILQSAKEEPLNTLNNKAFWDPRVIVIEADAVHWLRRNKAQYDAIYLDFPYPSDLDQLGLYSYEMFRLVFNALSSKGFICLDAPIKLDSENKNLQIIAATLRMAGFSNNIAAFVSKGEGFIIAAKRFIPEEFNGELKKKNISLRILSDTAKERTRVRNSLLRTDLKFSSNMGF